MLRAMQPAALGLGGFEPGLAGHWDDLVVVCAGTSWDGVWFPEKHIADRLAARAPVLYVDPPLSVVAPWRQPALAESLQRPRLRLIRPNLARFTPTVLPGMYRMGVPEVDDLAVRQLLGRAVSRLTSRVRAVIVASPSAIFGACGERRKICLLYTSPSPRDKRQSRMPSSA